MTLLYYVCLLPLAPSVENAVRLTLGILTTALEAFWLAKYCSLMLFTYIDINEASLLLCQSIVAEKAEMAICRGRQQKFITATTTNRVARVSAECGSSGPTKSKLWP